MGYYLLPTFGVMNTISRDLHISTVFGLVGAGKLGSLCRPFATPFRQGALCDAMSSDFHIYRKM